MKRIHIEVLIFVLATSLGAFLIAYWAWRQGGLSVVPAAPLLMMMTPALVALIMTKAQRGSIRHEDGLGLRMRGWKQALVAMVAMSGLTGLSVGLSLLFFESLRAPVEEAVTHVMLPIDLAPSVKIALALVVTALVGPILNLPFMLGEELGWRGYMAPRLRQIFGRFGAVVGGAIWGAWHWPAILLLGYNYQDARFTGALLFPVICIALSVLFTRAREASGTVLAPALMHGALNQTATAAVVILYVQDRFNPLIQAPTGVLMIATLAPPALWAYQGLRGRDGQPN